jgi:hypothetical protein
MRNEYGKKLVGCVPDEQEGALTRFSGMQQSAAGGVSTTARVLFQSMMQ